MNIGVLYVISCAMCFFEIALIINRTKQTKYRETIDSHFCYMLYYFAFFCCIDMLWGFFSSQTILIWKTGFTIISYGFHLGAAICAFIWFAYIMDYTGTSGAHRAALMYLRGILLVIQVLVLVFNFFNHSAFYVDDQCNYYVGPLRNALYLLQYVYYTILILYSLYNIIKHNKVQLFTNALLFSLVPLGFGILQFIFYDAALYSIGFMLSAFIIYSFNVTTQREMILEERYHSLNRRQTSIIYGLAGNFEAIYYVDIETGRFEIYKKDEQGKVLFKEVGDKGDYFDSIMEEGKKIVVLQEREEFLVKFTKENLVNKLNKKGSFSEVVRLKFNGKVKYIKYTFVHSKNDDGNYMIVGVYDVDAETKAEIKRQNQERQYAYDALTDLFTRRIYENDMAKISRKALDDDLVYISFDLNGLKVINDSLGHEAGDELISAAAKCMSKCFSDNGKLYRIGGDEFAAILYVDEETLTGMTERFESDMKKWRGKHFDTLSISYGIVCAKDAPGLSFREIANLADMRMYTYKKKYYAKMGVDRKGQQEAFDVVCKSYTKILKANLTQDDFAIIQLNLNEKCDEMGYSDKVSEWMINFGATGNIHEDDMEFYKSHVNTDYIRQYFMDGNRYLCFYYRRKTDDIFRMSLLEVMPAGDYADDDQNVFMYVKNIDRLK